MDIKTKLALTGQLSQLLSDLSNGNLSLRQRIAKSVERTELLKKLGSVVIEHDDEPTLSVEFSKNDTHYTPENVELANKVTDLFKDAGWTVNVTDNKKDFYSSAIIHFSSEKGIGYIGSFSALKRSLSGDKAGSFTLSFSRELFDDVINLNVRPSPTPDAQAKRLFERVNEAYSNPLKVQELSGLSLYSPVNIDGKAYVIGNALFNDEHVMLYTKRDFHSFKFDLDGVQANQWNDKTGKFDYLGQDKSLSMSIPELEQKTGRKWGKKRYSRKAWAIAKLETYTRCIVIQTTDGGYWLVPASFVADGPKGSKLIGYGKDVPADLIKSKFEQDDDDDTLPKSPKMLLESACVHRSICKPIEMDW